MQSAVICRRRRAPRLSGALRPRRGQSFVELALVAIIMSILALGVVEFGRLYLGYIAVTEAARQGGRVAVDPGHDVTAIVQAVRTAAFPYSVAATVLPAGS